MNEEVGFKLFGESWFHDLSLVISSPEFNALGNFIYHVLEAGHPASGCYGKDLFSGCKHFSKVNKILEDINGTDNILRW